MLQMVLPSKDFQYNSDYNLSNGIYISKVALANDTIDIKKIIPQY